MQQPARDLFGQVPVTWPEVFDWVEVVAGIPRTSPRAARYAASYRVADKVARAKLAGQLDAILQRPAPPAEWFRRFDWR